MDKLLPRLVLIATASISLSGPAIAEWQLASPLPSSFMTRPNAAVVLVVGMGGGNTTGGMGAGTTGGMGGGSTTGGMGRGTGGGWGGFGDMTSPAAGGFGTAAGSPSWNSPQPAYYTYQCVTPAGQCSFTAPAVLRSSSLQAGARCACAAGQPEGRVR
jgi:hypothetical protein